MSHLAIDLRSCPNLFRENRIAPFPQLLPDSLHANGSNDWYDHEFGGFTVPLTRQSGDRLAELPEPSQAGTYTIKIIIQDVVDHRVDAALFVAKESVKFQPVLAADFNLDGVVDISDFNIWNGNKTSNSDRFTHGDANGDGVVDVSDFNIWNSNKFQGGGYKYQVADFNDDGVVDVSDFNIWNENKTTPSCASRFDGDADGDGDVDNTDRDIWQAMCTECN